MARAEKINPPQSTNGPAGFRPGAESYGRQSALPSRVVSRYIHSTYGLTAPVMPVRYDPGRLRRLWQHISATNWGSPNGIVTITGTAVMLVAASYGFYCFNTLVRKSIDVQASQSRVDVLMQRRNDLTRNLEKAIVAERRHETAVFEDVSHQRFPNRPSPQAAPEPAPSLPGTLPGPSPSALPGTLPSPSALAGLSLEKLLAIVEQYPQVRLSENMQSLISAMVDVERDLGDSRKKLVDAMNVYLHEVHTFPSKFFAGIFGFHDVQFFRAGPEAGHLVPVQF